MLKDMNYNIIETISVVSKSLHRYDAYIKNSAQCKSCTDLWDKIKRNREAELKMLMKELKAHIDAGQVKFE